MHRVLIRLSAFTRLTSTLILAGVASFALAKPKVVDVIPAMLDFGDYVRANEAIMNLIGDELNKSRLLVQNVDASHALIIKAHFVHPKLQPRRIVIAYVWNNRVLSRASYVCPLTQERACASAIVKGAERAAHLNRLR